MELKHLVSYASVVRLGSFSRAAEELYIAQPTISLHVRQLEEELQTKLQGYKLDEFLGIFQKYVDEYYK
jgi:hypothetical protein